MTSLREVLKERLGDRAVRYTDKDIEALESNDYTDKESLETATRDGLKDAGLKPGKVDELLARFSGAAQAVSPVSSGSRDTLPITEPLRGPLLELVKLMKLMTTYIRHCTTSQFRYTISQATQHPSPQFKKALIEVYGCEDVEQPKKLFCMGLGRFMPEELVCNVHLFKHRWLNDVSRMLSFTHIHDPANGLLLLKPLKEAFDAGYMCICWDGENGDDRTQGDYRMFWLGPEDVSLHLPNKYPWYDSSNEKMSSQHLAELRTLKNDEGGHLRFNDLHDKPLTFRTAARPFRRCLTFQARQAAHWALTEGYIDELRLEQMKPYLISASPQASTIEKYWQRLPGDPQQEGTAVELPLEGKTPGSAANVVVELF